MIQPKLQLLCMLLLLPLCNVFSQIYPTYRDVDYVGNDLRRQYLDVYIPTNTDTPRPAIVYIHGGGWKGGSKAGNLSYDLRRLYQNAKFVIIDINYRFSTDSIWPAQIYDCKTAIRHIKEHAKLYQIDTCAIGVMGHSAGGHLAAILGTSIGIDSLEGYHQGIPTQNAQVHAVVDFFGPTDFLNSDEHYPDSCQSPVLYDLPDSMTSQLVGCQISECPERSQSANPITYIDGNEPPFLILHGTYDCIVPYQQSQLLDDALRTNNSPTELITVENAVHADSYFYSHPAINQITNFFVEQLLPQTCYQPPVTNIDSTSLQAFTIQPNPAQDFIFIDLKNDIIPDHIRIININGQTITQTQSTYIDIQPLPKGIYLIQLRFKDETVTQRFLKK